MTSGGHGAGAGLDPEATAGTSGRATPSTSGDALAAALTCLGTGFLRHPENGWLVAALRGGLLTDRQYHRALLRLAYQLLVLMIAEDRAALLDPAAAPQAHERYAGHFATTRLRWPAATVSGAPRRQLWSAQRRILLALGGAGWPPAGIPGLGGLFAADPREPGVPGQPDRGLLLGAELADEDLRCAIGSLSWAGAPRGDGHRPDLRHFGASELAEVHQAALELVPQLDVPAGEYAVQRRAGHARRASGSYYTPVELVDVVLDTALDPVLDGAVCNAASPVQAQQRLLAVTVCDPACGSGAFLVAAAQRIAGRLARLRCADEYPSAHALRVALRDVVTGCCFGADLDDLAVELAKVSLWLACQSPAMPLHLLDDHLRVGNSLLGATPALLAGGVPDAAFRVKPGDDRSHAAAARRRNRAERQSDMSLPDAATRSRGVLLAADAWCAAFLWPLHAGAAPPPTTGVLRELAADPDAARHADTAAQVRRLADEHSFFHWHLEFPEVLDHAAAQVGPEGWSGGFAVVLGNPPWIAHAGRAAQRLPVGVRRLYEATTQAFRGYATTHGCFLEAAVRRCAVPGVVGLVLPSSVADLAGYGPTRAAVRAAGGTPQEPIANFGDGAFKGVFQPSMALVVDRLAHAEHPADRAWALARVDLDEAASRLLHRLSSMPTMPAHAFFEAGLQTDQRTRPFIRPIGTSHELAVPIREGKDIRAFRALPPRLEVPVRIAGAEHRSCRAEIVLRQTARYPLAAPNDGLPFRNSLIGARALPGLGIPGTLALLNSRLVRWFHHQRNRDAREGMPQVKVSHLRALPMPVIDSTAAAHLIELGSRLCGDRPDPAAESDLNELVYETLGLSMAERHVVDAWGGASA